MAAGGKGAVGQDAMGQDAAAPVTVRAILGLEEMRRGEPEVLTGAHRLDARVSWVHIAETEEVASLLEGGEVILSSSAMFRSSPARTRAFLRRLEKAGAAAFVIEVVDASGELDRRDRDVVADAAESAGLPVVILSARTRFVRITQAAHRMLIGAQLARVEFSRRTHEVFTELSLEGADERRIVTVTAELAGTPVVLEDAGHRVLAFDSGDVPADELLADWPRLPGWVREQPTSPAPGAASGPAQTCAPGWAEPAPPQAAQVPVGVRGHRWGRLVAPYASSEDLDTGQILERAGQAVTLARMARQGERDLLQQATVEFLHELMTPSGMSEQRALARAASLGMRPCTAYVPVAIRLDEPGGAEPRDAQLRERALREELRAAARGAGAPVLAGGLRSGVFAAVLGLASAEDCDEVLTTVLARVNASLADAADAGGAGGPAGAGAAQGTGMEGGKLLDVGVGRTSPRLTGAGAELGSAIQVAGIAATMQVRSRPFHRFADVRLRGVLARLRDEPLLRAFAEAELGPLLPSGGGEGDEDGLRFLEVLLAEGGNKSAVADALHMSRPAVYARVRRVERQLGVSLEDPESRTSLHAALIWLQTEGLGVSG